MKQQYSNTRSPCTQLLLKTSDQSKIFHYTRCNMLKCVMSWRGLFLRHCARATQLLSKKCHIDGEPLATLRMIQPALDLNLNLPLQRQTCYRSTKWPVLLKTLLLLSLILFSKSSAALKFLKKLVLRLPNLPKHEPAIFRKIFFAMESLRVKNLKYSQ